MKCENCIYSKNCQFLATHKRANVEECTAFEDKYQLYKNGYNAALKDLTEALKEHAHLYNLETYHSFYAIDIEYIDDIVEELIKRKYKCATEVEHETEKSIIPRNLRPVH